MLTVDNSSNNSEGLGLLESFFEGFGSGKAYPKGTLLLENGEIPRCVYMLKSGFVRLRFISERGQETTLHICRPGEVFPLISTLGEVPNRYNYETWGEVVVFDAPVTQFHNFLKKETNILSELNSQLIKRISGLLLRLEYTLYGSSYQRVVATLLCLTKHFGHESKGQILLNQKFTHNEIATLAGLSREAVSLEMGKLKKKKLVSYKRSRVTIRDVNKLGNQLQTQSLGIKDEEENPDVSLDTKNIFGYLLGWLVFFNLLLPIGNFL